MNKSPAFQLYSNDFYVDTTDWSPEEVGVYTRLLLVEWSNGPLPNDLDRLARIAGQTPKKFRHNWIYVSTKFVQNGEGKLINLRLEQTREEQRKYSESRSNNVKKRWEKKDTYVSTHEIHNDIDTAYPSSSLKSIINNTLADKPVIDDNQTIPYQQIIGFYHKHLPMCPRIKDLTQERRKALKARWHQKKAYQDLEWWDEFFLYIAEKCPFLVGRGEKYFLITWDWIMKKANFVKIVEGNYER